MRRSVILSCALVAVILAAVAFWRVVERHKPAPGVASTSAGNVTQRPAPAPPAANLAPTNRLVATKPAAPPAPVPASIRPILAAAGRSVFNRLDGVKQLGGRVLQAEEISALFDFLQTKPPGTRGELDSEAFLKNEVLNLLLLKRQPPAGIAAVLASIHRDREQDEVMRDYAIQHLVVLYERVPAAAPERETIAGVLWEALGETDSSIAGTALLGLHNLALAGAAFDAARLGEAALRLAKEEQASELVRITALQVCAQRNVAEARPAAGTLAGGASTVPLQISAIAALGRLGTANDLPVLAKLAGGPDPRLQPAAQTALTTLRQRLEGAGAPARQRN